MMIRMWEKAFWYSFFHSYVNSVFTGGGRQDVVVIQSHHLKQLVKQYFPHLTKAQLAELADFSFYSLQRGGATWAWSRGVPLGLILA